MLTELATNVRKGQRLVRRWPWPVVAAYCADRAARAGRLHVHLYAIVSQPLKLPDLRRRCPSSQRVLQINDFTELEPYLDETGALFERTAAQLEARLSRGSRCFLLLDRGRAIGFQWFSLGQHRDEFLPLEVDCSQVPGCAWDFDLFLLSEYRSGLAFFYLWRSAAGALLAAGFDTTLSYISRYNEQSVRSHARLGAAPLASLLFVGGSRRQAVLSAGPPYLRFLSMPDDRLVLRVHRTPAGGLRLSY